jgi:S1-C subfamily serine protease
MKTIISLLFIIICLIEVKAQISINDETLVSSNYLEGRYYDKLSGRYIDELFSTGSGFFISDSVFVYLITAAHVIKRIQQFTDTLRVLSYPRNPSETAADTLLVILSKLNKEHRIIFYENIFKDTIDVVILVLGINKFLDYIQTEYLPGVIRLGAGTRIMQFQLSDLISYEKVNISSDCYVLGYPTSVGNPRQPQFIYTRPIIRHGIIAGKNSLNKTLIIDCPVYPGNSGGPVFVLNESNLFVAGLVTQFVPFIEEWQNKKYPELLNLEVENSGLGVVLPSNFIIDLIKYYNP